ncbi:hypothetical protein AVEN_218119-1 [Araneus ventricosus]|uniref:Uncharacterized protein n=1 Tax=Araneus ventricosus TaxID=182803 RepID=A0A4Y2I4X4_ARAVE|nr:hypothetical protein AVEN_218119-1 [Araneus ventricosus]
MPGDEVIGDSFQPFLFEVWRWLPHMPRHCVNTLRGIVKCRANSTTTAIIVVRQVKPFEVGRERTMLREEDNILSNLVSGMIHRLRTSALSHSKDVVFSLDHDRHLLVGISIGGCRLPCEFQYAVCPLE